MPSRDVAKLNALHAGVGGCGEIHMMVQLRKLGLTTLCLREG